MRFLLWMPFFLLLLSSCSKTDQRIIKDFEQNLTSYEELISQLKSDPAFSNNYGKLVSSVELSKASIDALKQTKLTEIRYIVLSKSSECLDEPSLQIEILFGANWHLVYEPCDNTGLMPGQHIPATDSFIESWGLSKNWVLWVNHDFIG